MGIKNNREKVNTEEYPTVVSANQKEDLFMGLVAWYVRYAYLCLQPLRESARKKTNK